MGQEIRLHLAPGFDKSLLPIPAAKLRDWWEDNSKTANHAKHCLPLQMANHLGYYILSPATFLVKWDGDVHAKAQIEIIERATHCEIDDHAAYGSFTVQAKFIPVTKDPGDFVMIKGIANERSSPYQCMEAAIEAWWSVGNFGLVFLLNQPGEFLIPLGKPIAQMFLYHGLAGASELQAIDGYPPGYAEWQARRSRKGYSKDLDYFKGAKATGEDVPEHITHWSQASKFKT